MMIGPTREDSKVVSQGELWELWNQDSNQPCWASLSRLLPSFLAVSAFVSLSFPSILSLFSASLPCFPFSSVTLSNSFLSLFQFQPFSSFLPSLSPPLYLSLLLSFAFSFLSSTLLFPFSGSIFPGSFLPSSSSLFLCLLSVLLLLSSLSVALPNVFLPLLLIKDLDSGFSVTQESATEGFG